MTETNWCGGAGLTSFRSHVNRAQLSYEVKFGEVAARG